jgi:ligand-binding SRPBCC domain-containing protein
MSIYQRSFEVKAALQDVAAFHDDPAALIAITPPPVRVTIERFDAPVQAGSQVIFRLHVGPIGVRWAAAIVEHETNRYFRDVQQRGPFGAWDHTHTFVAGPNGTTVIDRVEYQPPFGWFGRLIDPILVRPSLKYMFGYRARRTRALLEEKLKSDESRWVEGPGY